jgi:programmed cell death 6-interacting protein
MPPLSSLSITQQDQPAPPQSNTYYSSPPPPQPTRQQQPVVASPPIIEAQIQSWADHVPPQQPRPVPLPPVAGMQGTWRPDMGISFAQPGASSSGGQGQQQQQQQGGGAAGAPRGAWEPSKGIRFG